MNEAFICDAVRTPFGRYGGALASVRTDDLGAVPLRALMERNPRVDWAAVDDVVYGCANQAGEDNRNVGRMALLLAAQGERILIGTSDAELLRDVLGRLRHRVDAITRFHQRIDETPTDRRILDLRRARKGLGGLALDERRARHALDAAREHQ